MDPDQLVASARQLSRSLTPGDLDHTLSRVTAAAVEVLPDVDYASMTVLHSDGSLETVAPTDPLLPRLDAAQYELAEGPCYHAVTDVDHAVVPRLDEDNPYPRYAEVAVEAGVLAQAAVRLFDAQSSRGALNVYSRTPGAFADMGAIGALFQHQSALAIEYAQEIDSLTQAISTRHAVGQAVGVVMERYEFTDERAFAFLTRLALHHQVPLPVVAHAIAGASDVRNAERTSAGLHSDREGQDARDDEGAA